MGFHKYGVYGILCIVGGTLLAYFGYFAYPYLLLFGWAGLSGLSGLLSPFLLILLGIAFVYLALIDRSGRSRKIKKKRPAKV